MTPLSKSSNSLPISSFDLADFLGAGAGLLSLSCCVGATNPVLTFEKSVVGLVFCLVQKESLLT